MKMFDQLDEAALFVLSISEGVLKIAAPLGLGKANQLLNIIYDQSKKSSRELEIYSALSLDTPKYKSALEKKLLEPFIKRHFGDYPKLQYVSDLQNKEVPSHIKIHEFYFLAGQFAEVREAQQNYISLNYTHAAQGLAARGLQVIIQIIAKRQTKHGASYSLSCNPDLTLDLFDLYRAQNKKIYIIGVVHPDLPFLGGDAEVTENFFDAIVESPDLCQPLFALPRNPIDQVDHFIGLHASQMVQDDGTIQIGIGSLSDSLVHWLLVRQQQNVQYKSVVNSFWKFRQPAVGLFRHQDTFVKGLYGTSEMLMDGFMHLRRAKILNRFVFDQDEKKSRYLHAAFFLGSKKLYEWLNNLSEVDYDGLSMTRVSKVNDLYDPHELALRRQRKNARFFNTAMQVNLLGGVASDTLDNGQVISGVGGQYNFVAMSQELPDSHSVVMLRSTRRKKGKRYSNIVASLGQLTIPRHLRDVVITEYGIANLKGRTDSEVIQSLIEISDSEFQPGLVTWAKKNKKLSDSYTVPDWAAHNTPSNLHSFTKPYASGDLFSEAPFGLDFTNTELRLIKALGALKEKSLIQVFKILLSGIAISNAKFADELAHMKLTKTKTFQDYFLRLVVKSALYAQLKNG